MTNEEFDIEFDVYYNSIASNQAPGLNSYEKSVFLTQAQEAIAKSLYSGTLTGDSFEKTEELRRYLSDLITSFSTEEKLSNKEGLTQYSQFFSIPEDAWFITYESARSNDDSLGCSKGNIMEVVPITQDEIHNVLKNPFRSPSKRRVLRLDNSGSVVELISKYNISTYQIRYLRRPTPIILHDLEDGLSIGRTDSFTGTKKTECKLNPALHRIILEMAVNLAAKSMLGAGK